MKKVYISGPITGLPMCEVKDNFMKVEKEIKDFGHKPINPLKVSPFSTRKTYKDYLIDDIEALIRCDAIYLMPGWKKSKGANLEFVIAKELGLDIFFIANE